MNSSKKNMPAVRVMKNDLDNYVPGVGYARIPDYCGHFHAWGLELHEQNEGSANYTVAIVEKEDGSIQMVYPTFIQFIREANSVIEQKPFKQFKTGIIEMGLVEEGDGLSKEEILDLRNCEWDDLEVTVICEASDGYYDVLLPNGRVINALSEVHLAAIMKDA